MSDKLHLLTLQEAMDLLQISRSTINRWRREKGLPFIKIGRDVFIDKDQLLFWIDNHIQAQYQSNPENKQSTETITIGYQSMNAHLWSSLVIKELHLFEKELLELKPARPIRVRWRNLHGPSQLEEMAAGKINIASIGDYPLINAYKLNSLFPSFQARLLAFDGKNANGEGISLVIPRKSEIRTIEQLSNRKISTFLHSSAWHRLFKTFSDVVSVQPQIISQDSEKSFDDILNKHVDACTMVEPYLSMIQHYQLGKSIKLDGCEDDYLTGIVSDEKWVVDNEDIVVAYLKAHLRAHQLIRNNPLQVSKIISQYTDFPIEVVSHVLSRIRWDAAIYRRDLQTLGDIGKTHSPAHHGLHNHFDAKSLQNFFVNDSYLIMAAKQMKLPQLFHSIFDEEWIPNPVY